MPLSSCVAAIWDHTWILKHLLMESMINGLWDLISSMCCMFVLAKKVGKWHSKQIYTNNYKYTAFKLQMKQGEQNQSSSIISPFFIVGSHIFLCLSHITSHYTKFSTTKQIDSSLNFWPWRHPSDGVNWSDRCNAWLLNEVDRMKIDSKTSPKVSLKETSRETTRQKNTMFSRTCRTLSFEKILKKQGASFEAMRFTAHTATITWVYTLWRAFLLELTRKYEKSNLLIIVATPTMIQYVCVYELFFGM